MRRVLGLGRLREGGEQRGGLGRRAELLSNEARADRLSARNLDLDQQAVAGPAAAAQDERTLAVFRVDPVALAHDAAEAGLKAEPVDSAREALERVAQLAKGDDRPPRILIGGSLYFAGNILEENGTPPE